MTSIVSTLIVRCDASQERGTGHAMRCLALAQRWAMSEGPARFAMAESLPSVTQRGENFGTDVQKISVKPASRGDVARTIDLVRDLDADAVVIDGYHFDSTYQHSIAEIDVPTLYIDDLAHLESYPTDLILNQNLSAHSSLYEGVLVDQPRLLLGVDYLLLRQEFDSWTSWTRPIPERGSTLLVTMGGTDPRNISERVVREVLQVRDRDITLIVVVGGANDNLPELRKLADSFPSAVRLELDVEAMGPLMGEADAAVTAGGSTCWELAYMQVPMVILTLYDNQICVGRSLDLEGAAWNLGRPEGIEEGEIGRSAIGLLENKQERERMAEQGRRLIDGRGTDRVVQALVEAR